MLNKINLDSKLTMKKLSIRSQPKTAMQVFWAVMPILMVFAFQSFDRCVEIDDEECIGPTLKGSFAIIPMFCGHEDFCQ